MSDIDPPPKKMLANLVVSSEEVSLRVAEAVDIGKYTPGQIMTSGILLALCMAEKVGMSIEHLVLMVRGLDDVSTLGKVAMFRHGKDN